MAADADAPSRALAPTASGVLVVDSPVTRVRRFTDVIEMLATALGILITLLVSAYAQATAEGITEDIQGISPVLQRLLVAPVNIFSGVVTLVIPAVIIVSLFVRKEPRRVLEAIGASIAGFALAGIAAFLIYHYGSEPLVASLSVPNSEGVLTLQIPAYIAAVAAMLTAAGRRTTRRSISTSWTLLWIAAAVAVISGIVSAPAALLTIFVGRLAGLAVRYAVGSTADRAYGDILVGAIKKAGFSPRKVVRADADTSYVPEGVDDVTAALARTRVGRVYSVTTRENHHLFAVALDGDQHVAGFLSKLWSTLRLRGLATRADVSLRQSAQTTALASHAARTAGVRTPRVLGMASARDTFVLVYQRPTGMRALRDIPADEVTDEMLDALWFEVSKAHAANLAHRAITADSVMFDASDPEAPLAWVTSWELGEVAASDLAIRIDRAQVVALLATIVGPERAVDSAFRNLESADVERFAPLLQSIALPRATRAALKEHRSEKILDAVREGVLERLPNATVEAENITRFGGRTVITLLLALVVGGIILVGLNTQKILEALEDSNPWWLLVAFGWMLLTFVGAALALIAFSPVKLPWWRVLMVQVAATYVALAVPAGVGPAAMNGRMLTKRGVPAPLAVATVALIQVSAVFVTVTGLVTLTLLTGSEGTLAALPSTAILIGVGASIAVVALSLLVPRVRRFASAKVLPTLSQTWPRLAQILSQPGRLLLGIAGNAVLTLGFIGAFHATLEALGQDVALVDLAVVFFLGNTVGALIPTPGGIGAVEIALSTALTAAGVNPAVALSAALVYRFITFWIRIPMGFFAMKYLERKGEL
jgi:uncharacterized membrane protein YbhN (UPF0104 family)